MASRIYRHSGPLPSRSRDVERCESPVELDAAICFLCRALKIRALSFSNRGPIMPVINSVTAMRDEITAWRRDMHEHPEILYAVHRTAALVADKLRAFGCDEVVPG